MNDFKPRVVNCADSLLSATDKANHIRDHFSAMYWAVIAPINNVAIMEIKTAYDLLKKSKLFKREIKRKAKLTMERIDKYDNAVCRTMKQNVNGDRTQYWLDYIDEHYASVKSDLDIFYMSVLQLLTKYDEPKRNLKARLVTSHALLNYAIGMFDAYFVKVNQTVGIDISEMFMDARLSYVMSVWEEVVNALCISECDVDVDNDKNVKLAFNVIERRLTDPNWLHDIGDIALSYNPDILEDMKYANPMNTDDNFEKSLNDTIRNKD